LLRSISCGIIGARRTNIAHLHRPGRATNFNRTDLQRIAGEVLGLSKMSRNTFDLYTKLPATLQSLTEIARIGALLQRFGAASYIIGYLSRGRPLVCRAAQMCLYRRGCRRGRSFQT
jgi:hypothetical protein